MPYISEAEVNGVTYDVKDKEAREKLETIPEIDDNDISLIKTWSSSKINGEVSDLKSQITSDDWITPEMINGNNQQPEYVSTLLNDSAYSYRTSSGKLGFMSSDTSCAIEISIADLPNDIDYIYWDYDHTTNQSSQPIVITTGVNAGDAVVGYFSQSEIANGSTSFNTYGGLYDAENHILRVSIAEIRSRKPNGTFVVLAVANGVNAYIYADVTPKKLKWLKISGENAENLLIVDSDGNGDFTTIQSAIDSAHDNDTIYILDGEYKETVVVNKYLHLVGQSKQGVVLYQNIGDYDNCPLLITQGSVCNMTIKSIAPADTSGLSNYAYAIHLDKNFSLTNGKCEIYNCDIYSEVNDAIGSGTNYAQVYDLHDNRIFVSADPVKAGACGLKCHIGSGQTGGKVTLKNNTIIAVGSNGTSFYDILFHDAGISGVSNCEVELIGNVCRTFRNASSFFTLNDYCANNTVAAMNTIN